MSDHSTIHPLRCMAYQMQVDLRAGLPIPKSNLQSLASLAWQVADSWEQQLTQAQTLTRPSRPHLYLIDSSTNPTQGA